MSNVEAHHLELRGHLSELRRLAGWIKAEASHELTANISFAIQLCLEEAVANGSPRRDGNSQASALISTLTAGGKTRWSAAARAIFEAG
jgi:hypothetical protein